MRACEQLQKQGILWHLSQRSPGLGGSVRPEQKPKPSLSEPISSLSHSAPRPLAWLPSQTSFPSGYVTFRHSRPLGLLRFKSSMPPSAAPSQQPQQNSHCFSLALTGSFPIPEPVTVTREIQCSDWLDLSHLPPLEL